LKAVPFLLHKVLIIIGQHLDVIGIVLLGSPFETVTFDVRQTHALASVINNINCHI